MLQTAKVQRWSPEELLRTLVEAEIAARDDSNARARLRQAGFPVTKTLAEFNLGLSSVPQASWDYLASLEWIRAAENLCLVGPAGTGKSHALIALGHAAVSAGMRVRYFAAADLVETLYRGMADNSVGSSTRCCGPTWSSSTSSASPPSTWSAASGCSALGERVMRAIMILYERGEHDFARLATMAVKRKRQLQKTTIGRTQIT